MKKITLTLLILNFSLYLAKATDYTWTGSTNSNWNTPSNWSPTGVPSTTDKAIINAGTINLDIAPTIQHLVFAGGTIDGNQNLTVLGTFDWTGGSFLRSTSSVIIGGLTTISTTTYKAFDRAITLNGGALWTSGNINVKLPIYPGVTYATFIVPTGVVFTIDNAADINLQSDYIDCNSPFLGGCGLRTNLGFDIKTGGKLLKKGAGYCIIDFLIGTQTNAQVEVQVGRMDFGGGLLFSSGLSSNQYGTFNVAANAFLGISGGQSSTTSVFGNFFKSGSSITGAGTFINRGKAIIEDCDFTVANFTNNSDLQFEIDVNCSGIATNSGNLTFNGAASLGKFVMTTGTLAGLGDIEVIGDCNISGNGTNIAVNGATSTTLTVGGTTTWDFSSGMELTMNNRAWICNGDVVWLNNGTTDGFINNPNMTIASDKTFRISNVGRIQSRNAGIGITFGGNMIKEGIGQVYIPQMILSTTSQIQINQGVLGLGSGSQTILKGAITVAANAFLGFDAFASLASGTSIVGQGSCYIVGTITIDNTITFNIANIDLWAGTLTLNKDITLSKLNMGGGVISGSGKLTITGDFHFQGGEIRNQTIANGNTYIEGANNSLYDGTINNGRGIANGGELTLNGSITYSYDNRFSIQGKLIIGAASVLSITNTSTYYFESIGSPAIIENYGIIRRTRSTGVVNFYYNTNGITLINKSTGRIEGLGKFASLSTNFVNEGVVAPGLSPGKLQWIDGTFTNSTLEMEINSAGTAGTAYDQLAVTGDFVSGGIIQLNFTNGFNPSSGTFDLVTYTGNLSGSLPTVTCVNANFNPVSVSLVHNIASKKLQLIVLSTVLPVELLSFTAQYTEAGNLLTWQTASEINTAHFDIERSTDGKTFEKIGETKAQSKAATYNYTDRHPLSITTYYRLKINDFDGKSDYSKVISISRNDKTKVKVYPNPTKDVLTIEWGKEAPTTIRLLDILGRVLMYKTEQTGTTTLDLSAVTEGVYFVEVVTKGQSWREKIVKQ